MNSFRVPRVPLITWLWHFDQPQQGKLIMLPGLISLKDNVPELKPLWDFPQHSLPHKVKSQLRDRVLWVKEDLDPLYRPPQPSPGVGPEMLAACGAAQYKSYLT